MKKSTRTEVGGHIEYTDEFALSQFGEYAKLNVIEPCEIGQQVMSFGGGIGSFPA